MATSGPGTRPRPQPSEAVPDDPELDEVDAASAASMDASDPPAFGGTTGIGSEEGAGDERTRRINERAHEMWREAGSLDGRAMDFWLAAEREFDAGPAGQSAAP